MDRFCDCLHLGCADCAFGSLNDLASLIDRDHFLFVFLGSYRDCNYYSVACYFHSDCRTTVVEGHNGFVVLVCVVRPFSPSAIFFVLPANMCVMEFIMMACPAVAFLAPEGW
jgi:hypothetical protein